MKKISSKWPSKIFLSLFLIIVVGIAKASAATITVNSLDNELNNDGDCSFREAIAASEANANVDGCIGVGSYGDDTIDLSTLSGTIQVSGGELHISQNLTIKGPGANNLTLDGVNKSQRLFNFNSLGLSKNLNISDLEIKNFGSSFGGAFLVFGGDTLQLTNTKVDNNTSVGQGGALYSSQGIIKIVGSIFDSNTAGSDGGAIFLAQGQFTLNGASLLNNTAQTGKGGGINVNAGGDIISSTFFGNSAPDVVNGDGGGLYISTPKDININNSTTLQNNTAGMFGGGIYYQGIANNQGLTIDSSTIEGNNAQNGAGIYTENSGSKISIFSGTIQNNNASNSGGGIYMNSSASVLIDTSSNIISNHANIDGGGIMNSQGNLTVNVSFINSNTANNGAGLYNKNGGTADLSNTNTFSSNQATTNGGGIYVESGTVNMNQSDITNGIASNGAGVYILAGGSLTAGKVKFLNNTAAFDGGGIYNNGTADVNNSLFDSNMATDNGGAVVSEGTTTIKNSTFSSNSGSFGGGALYNNNNSSNLTLINSTLQANSASFGGGLLNSLGNANIINATFYNNIGSASGASNLHQNGGNISLKNTLITRDGVAGPGNNCVGTITDNGNNLRFGDNSCPVTIQLAAKLPLFPALSNNGGPTSTLALIAGSEAIDTGDNNACADATTVNNLDQRGDVRPVDGDGVNGAICDIGAYEYTAPPAPQITQNFAVTPNPTSDNTPDYGFKNGTEDATIHYGANCPNATPADGSSVTQNADVVVTFGSPVPLADGTYSGCTIKVHGTQSNLDSNTLTVPDFTVNAGVVGPTLTLVSEVSPNPTFATQPTYTFNTNQSGTLNLGANCPVSKPANNDSVSAGDVALTFGPLNPNTYSGCTITVTNAAGGVSNTLTVADFQVLDATPGSISGFVYTDFNSNGSKDAGESGIANVTINLTGTDLAGATINTSTQTQADGSYSFSNLLAGNYAVSETQPANYNDGGETVGSLGGSNNQNDELQLTLAANQNGTGYNFSEIDVTAPTLSEVVAVATPTNDNTPNYTFSSDEDGTISFSGDCTSQTSNAVAGNNTITFDQLADGTHNNCIIHVTDASGNISQALNVTAFTVDTSGNNPVAPNLKEVTAVNSPTNDSTPDYTFSSDQDGTLSYSGGCTSSITSIAANNPLTITFDNPALADGTYDKCIITVTGSISNLSSQLSVSTFTVDTTTPVLSEVTPVLTPTTNTSPQYTFSSSEGGKIAYGAQCPVVTPVNGSNVNTGNTTITFGPLNAGNYTGCTISVSDDAGNTSNLLTVPDFQIVNQVAPVIKKVTAIKSPINDSTPSYIFSSNEDGTITYGGSAGCTSTTTDIIANTNTTITFEPALADGDYDCTIIVKGKNSGLNSNILDVPFTIDTKAPVLKEVTLVPVKSSNKTPSYTFSSDKEGKITYSGDCSSQTTTGIAGNNTIAFNALTVGTHSNCKITVTDAAGNSSQLSVSAFTIESSGGGGGGGGGGGVVGGIGGGSSSNGGSKNSGGSSNNQGSGSNSGYVGGGGLLDEFGNPVNIFTDIQNHWAEKAIRQIAAECKVNGYEDASGKLLHLFKPDNEISRAELLTMLIKCRYGTETTTVAPFPDVPVSHWAAGAIAYGKQVGIVEGYPDGKFKPDNKATRSEAIKMILLAWKSLEEIKKAAPSTACKDIVAKEWYAPYYFFALDNGIIQGYKDAKGVPTGLCGVDKTITRAETAKVMVGAKK